MGSVGIMFAYGLEQLEGMVVMKQLLVLAGLFAAGCGQVGLEPLVLTSSDGVLEIDHSGGIAFGNVSPAADPVTEEVQLLAAGDFTIRVTGVYLDDDTSQAFSISDTLPLPLSLEPGAAFPVNVSFDPSAVGQYTGYMVVVVDDGYGEMEVERAVTGRGCADYDDDGVCG